MDKQEQWLTDTCHHFQKWLDRVATKDELLQEAKEYLEANPDEFEDSEGKELLFSLMRVIDQYIDNFLETERECLEQYGCGIAGDYLGNPSLE